MTTTFQDFNEHAVSKVGYCPFCRHETAELWRDPTEMCHPFQVRCGLCGARGPWCDCGEESAVSTWRSTVVNSALLQQAKGHGGGDG